MACGLSDGGSRAREHRLSSCCVQAYLSQGMWYIPGPGSEPMRLTTEPPGKPKVLILNPIFQSGIEDYHPSFLIQHAHKTNTEYQSASASEEYMSQDSIRLGYRKELGIRKYSAVRNLKMKFARVRVCQGNVSMHQFSSVQLLSRVQLFVTPWTAAHQASLATTNSWSLLKLMSIESVMPYNHLILCCPLLHPPSIFPSIRVFSNELALRIRWPKYWT